MEEFIAEIAHPKPESIINSYRSFGYTLSTAIADIIDNSISANGSEITIDYFWNGENSAVTILDNGWGMTLEELVVAMTPGSKDPQESRAEEDLGRFGLGLKTASFSQCKRLTVITKKEQKVFKRCWDVDFVNTKKEWFLLDYVSDEKYLKLLEKPESGTLVIWEKLDRIVGSASSENEAVKSAFYNEFRIVHDHLALSFHRFLEQGKIRLFINQVEVEPFNPFLLNLDPKPEMGPPEVLEGNVIVTYYVLPHMSRIGQQDYEKTGGPIGWQRGQGFYVYRADRLLVAGDWLGIEKAREYSKLARVSVNFPNKFDFDWKLDIRKATATPPIRLRKDLSRIARIACMRSAQIYNWRGQKKMAGEHSGSIQRLWEETTTREGTKKYRINRSHFLIRTVLEGTASTKIISKALDLLEENIPLELILYNQNEDPGYHELEKISEKPSDSLIRLATDLYRMNVQQGVPEDIAVNQIMSSMPFNLYPLIKDYLS